MNTDTRPAALIESRAKTRPGQIFGHLRWRVASLVAFLAVLVFGAVGTCSAMARPEGPKPTIVIAPGAFAEASSWHGVVVRLQNDGYRVIAAALPMRGLASDAAYLDSLLATIKGPVVLAGHSWGGMVITVAGTGDRHVKSLVYVDAFLPAPGENAEQLINKFPGSQIGTSVKPVPFSLPGGVSGTDLYFDPAKYRAEFTGTGVSARDALAQAATQRPIAQSALREPAPSAAWQTKPSWDVIGTRDRLLPPAAQRFMAHRAKAHITSIPAAHASMLTFPGKITKVIEHAAS
jgi:pimeloyl-ACP methyl ester carboxylesterase